MLKPRSGASFEKGSSKGNVLASYAHLNLASWPKALARFIEFCGRLDEDKTSCSLDGGGS